MSPTKLRTNSIVPWSFMALLRQILGRVTSTSAVDVLLWLLERTIINRLGIGVTVIDPFNRIGLVTSITVHVSPRLFRQPGGCWTCTEISGDC